MKFRWHSWNIDHIAEHGVTPAEVEFVVRHARAPYPRRMGGGKYIVRGQTEAGDYIQVIYVLDPKPTRFVIHARPLTQDDKRRHRRERQ